MDKQQVRTIYGRYSSVYDLIFSHLFSPRIKLGLKRSGIEEGDRILEVGVGTGISLASYPDSCKVVGIDLTRKMLEKAKEKKAAMQLDNVDLAGDGRREPHICRR